METAPEQLKEITAVAQITSLLFVISKPGGGKSQALRCLSSQHNWAYVDCRELLTEEFLELTPAARAQNAPVYMKKLLEEYQSSVILLDRLQVLFTPMLRLSPYELLTQLSKHFTVIAAWPGEYKEGCLMYQNLMSTDVLSFPVIPEQVYRLD